MTSTDPIIIYSHQDDHDEVSKLGFPTQSSLTGYKSKDLASKVVIRWGKSAVTEYFKNGNPRDFPNVLNKASAIRLNCQKPVALKKLGSVVRTPTMYWDRVPAGHVAVVRPLTHGSGKGFRVVKGPYEVPVDCYATQYIRTKGEWRCWFCSNKTMMARRCRAPGGVNAKHPCRSLWGYQFMGKVPLALHNMVNKASRRIGLDIGAADVLYKDGQWVILELNSSISVDHRRIRDFYRANILGLAHSRYPKLVKLPKKVKSKGKT